MKIVKHIYQIGFVLALAAISTVGCGSNNAGNESEQEQAATPETETVALESPIETVQEVVLNNGEKGEYELKGKISGISSPLVYLQKFQSGQLVFVDTARAAANGQYTFSGQEGNSAFYYVSLNSNQPPGVPLLLAAGEKVQLDIEVGDFYQTSIKGGNENKKLKELFDLYMSHNKTSKTFSDKVQRMDATTMSDSMKMALQLEFNSLNQKHIEDVEDFVEQNTGSLASFFAVTYVLQKPGIDLLDDALGGLKNTHPGSVYTAELENRINSVLPLEVGGQAPDISLTSPDGNLVKLSSLRGNYVLIDFWASWCRPCRAENPNVVRMYQKYHEKGFEIYSVSLDNSADRWKNAIQQDGLTWTHVSDLKGWKSSAAALYKVSSIPQTFLLDKKGRIVAKNLRGHQLESKLAEIFN